MASETITIARVELTAEVSRALIDSLNAELSGVYPEPGATRHASAFAKQAPGQNGGRMGDVSQKHSAHTGRDVPLFDGRGIDHVGIRYHDLQKAVGWFRDTLGLPVDHETRTMAFVRVGGDGSPLALFQAEGDEPLRQPHHVALRVPDTATAEAALRTAGVPLRRFGPNWGFQDPEGNVFHFMPSR